MGKISKMEFKGMTNTLDIAAEMLTDLYNYRAALKHPRLQQMFDEIVMDDYDPIEAAKEAALWGTSNGTEGMAPGELVILDSGMSSAQKARAMRKLRASWSRASKITPEDRAFARSLRIQI